MRHIFIVNPTAGTQSALNDIQAKTAALRLPDCEVYATRAAGDATQYVRARCAQEREPLRFYACGGDGTLHETVNGAAGFEHAAVGCYPCGSGNDFVKTFGGAAPFRDLRALTQGSVRRVDLLRVNGRYAVNMLNLGLEALVAWRMARFRRTPLLGGRRAYYAAIALTLIDGMRHPCRLTADGEPFWDGALLLGTLANGRYAGGSFCCAPRADVSDGKMELCVISTVSRFKLLRLIGVYQRGEHLQSPALRPYVRYRTAQRAEIFAEKPLRLSVDGEILQDAHFTVEVAPGALRLIMPQGARLPETKDTEAAG